MAATHPRQKRENGNHTLRTCLIFRNTITQLSSRHSRTKLAAQAATIVFLTNVLCHLAQTLSQTAQSSGLYISPTAQQLLDDHNYRTTNPPTKKAYILYRALGNSLPPRHSADQTYTNLVFTLRHEPALEEVDKRWYVNRLLNSTEESRIIKLLLQHKQTFIVDSINWEVYRRLDHRVGEYRGYPLHRGGGRLKRRRALVRDELLHDKMLYVMNNNGARNGMVRLGIEAGARYVMPFDGNVFVPGAAWRVIRRTIENSGDGDGMYFAVPMARVERNLEALSDGVGSAATEEPQVMFHRASTERFNESLRYGRRPKVELLWRLGVRGRWTGARVERRETKWVRAGSMVQSVGWVVRLADGVGVVGVTKDAAWRGRMRGVGVETALARADWDVNEGTWNGVLFDAGCLERMRRAVREGRRGVGGLLMEQVRGIGEGADVCKIGLAAMARDITAMAVAGFISDNNTLCHTAARHVLALLRGMDLDTRKCIDAHLLAARVLPAMPLVSVVEAVRLLAGAGWLSSAERAEVRVWFRRFGGVLDRLGRRVESGEKGVWFDLLSGLVGVGGGEFVRVVRAGSFARLRLNGAVGDVPRGERVAWWLLKRLALRVGVEMEDVGELKMAELEEGETAKIMTQMVPFWGLAFQNLCFAGNYPN